MLIFLTEFTGMVLVLFSLSTLWPWLNKKPEAAFAFEDGEYEVEIKARGYYAIAILGAGSAQYSQRASITAIMNNREQEVVAYGIGTRFTEKGKKVVECWGFAAPGTGLCKLTLSGLQETEVKYSGLSMQAFFEEPLDHTKLRILVYKSVTPLRLLISICSGIVGVGLIVVGVAYALGLPR